MDKASGLKELLSLIDPVWKFSREELVKMMIDRVVYEDGNVIIRVKTLRFR